MRARVMEIDGLDCEVEETLDLEIDDETYKLLVQIANERGITVDELAEDALRAAMDKIDEDIASGKTIKI